MALRRYKATADRERHGAHRHKSKFFHMFCSSIAKGTGAAGHGRRRHSSLHALLTGEQRPRLIQICNRILRRLALEDEESAKSYKRGRRFLAAAAYDGHHNDFFGATTASRRPISYLRR